MRITVKKIFTFFRCCFILNKEEVTTAGTFGVTDLLKARIKILKERGELPEEKG